MSIQMDTQPTNKIVWKYILIIILYELWVRALLSWFSIPFKNACFWCFLCLYMRQATCVYVCVCPSHSFSFIARHILDVSIVCMRPTYTRSVLDTSLATIIISRLDLGADFCSTWCTTNTTHRYWKQLQLSNTTLQVISKVSSVSIDLN